MKSSFALLVFLRAATASAQEVQISGQAGWGARVVRGDWAPVTVDLENRGAKDRDVGVVLVWGFSGLSQAAAKPALSALNGRVGPARHVPVAIAAGARKRFSLSVVAPDRDGLSLWAYALTPSGTALDVSEFTARPRAEGRRLVAVVGINRPPGLEPPAFEVAWTQPDSLPDDWRGFGGLDAVVWLDGAADEVRTPAQLDALRTWVSAGGHLVVARANDIGLARTPLADLLPVTLRGTKEAELVLFPNGTVARTAILDAVPRRGEVILAKGDSSVRVDAPHDAGRVTFLGFDPARPPLAGSKEALRFWEDLLGAPAAANPNPSETRLRPPYLLGSTSLARQAATFPNVTPPAIGGLFLILLIYLAIVGPGDYIGLRLLRRLEFTWLTFPAYVGGFTVLILILGSAFMRTSAHQRETGVADHYIDSGFFRRRSVAALLAPSDTPYRFGDAEPIATNFLSRSFHEDSSGELTGVTVLHGRTREVRDWSLDRGATGLALSDRCGKAPSPLTFTIDSIDDSRVVLSVKNDTGTDLASATLVTPRGTYPLGPVTRGARALEGFRTYRSYREFAGGEGSGPDAPQRPQYFDSDGGGDQVTEEQLNAQVMKTLTTLSFPAGPSLTKPGERSGFARSLDARRWVDSGGSVLLAWARSSEDAFGFSPGASRRTTLVLARFFKGPG